MPVQAANVRAVLGVFLLSLGALRVPHLHGPVISTSGEFATCWTERETTYEAVRVCFGNHLQVAQAGAEVGQVAGRIACRIADTRNASNRVSEITQLS